MTSRNLLAGPKTQTCVRTTLLVLTQKFVLKHVILVGTHVYVLSVLPVRIHHRPKQPNRYVYTAKLYPFSCHCFYELRLITPPIPAYLFFPCLLPFLPLTDPCYPALIGLFPPHL
jgi:hypothetical protein